MTELADRFTTPTNSTHRQYEALRAYFVEHCPGPQVAARFGYAYGSFRQLVSAFRHDPTRQFFRAPPKGPHQAPRRQRQRERIMALRKQQLSIYDIAATLADEGTPLSAVSIGQVLKEEGFARLPRRADEDRPQSGAGPIRGAVADVRQLDLTPRTVHTQFGGLFVFLPFLARLPFDQLLATAGFPGSDMVPAGCAMRSLLGLKLFGSARHSQVMSAVLDPGLALFAGLNAIPKRSFLTEYSCRITPASYPPLMAAWFAAVNALGLARGDSFDLDFHTIPFHGADALLEKHYVTKRSRRQKGLLAFLAQDAHSRVFCYANAAVRKATQNDEILRFVEWWRARTGAWPAELIFDCRLTTYANLHQLNQRGIQFITLRRRSARMLADLGREPESAWRRIELEGVSRQYRTPRVLDREITLPGYEGPLRQLVVADLGHEDPTFLLTNQRKRTPRTLVGRYAQRMLIENRIADAINFFHLDALSSAVALKVDCDLQLTLMAGSLYRLLGQRLGRGYETATWARLFRDFVQATALVTVGPDELVVRLHKRAHHPELQAVGLADEHPVLPWLGGRRLRLVLG